MTSGGCALATKGVIAVATKTMAVVMGVPMSGGILVVGGLVAAVAGVALIVDGMNSL